MKHSWQWEPHLRRVLNPKGGKRRQTKKQRKIYSRVLRRYSKRDLDFNPRMFKKRIDWEF